MPNRRLKQLVIALLVVFSLFASSVSACICPHHQEKAGNDMLSCHQHSEMMPMQMDSPQIIQNKISQSVCCCLQPAPKVVSKSENLKFEKQTAELLPKLQFSFKAVPLIVAVKTIDFESLFYLSDSFYNISPSRAPPRL